MALQLSRRHLRCRPSSLQLLGKSAQCFNPFALDLRLQELVKVKTFVLCEPIA